MGVLRGYTLIIYKEVSYFFMLLFMMIFFAASEIKVKEINALCKQTSAYGDSLSSSPQADVLFYILGVYLYLLVFQVLIYHGADTGV